MSKPKKKSGKKENNTPVKAQDVVTLITAIINLIIAVIALIELYIK